MELFGMSLLLVGLFAGFGLLVGILFGFFGMGGSFLVIPALLVLGYPATVAVGSGLAFVFGTSVISALRHRAFGQVDYGLAVLMGAGTIAGIWVGKQLLVGLDRFGRADVVVSLVYVVLLGAVGLVLLRDARTGGVRPGTGRLAAGVRRLALPPLVSVHGTTVSAWSVLAVGLGIGVLSGCLGVGGGFLLLPVLLYGFGVPAPVAVGTDVVQILGSSAFGTVIYAEMGAVDVSVVAALLAGSALGARVGAGATRLVDEAAIEGYFAAMLLAGSVAVACEQVGTAYDIWAFTAASTVLVFGAVCLVSGAIVHASVVTVRRSGYTAGQ